MFFSHFLVIPSTTKANGHTFIVLANKCGHLEFKYV